MKKKLVLALILSFSMPMVSPLANEVAHADNISIENSQIKSYKKMHESNISKLNDSKEKILNLKESVKGTEYEKITKKLLNSINKLEKDAYIQENGVRFNPATIFDLDSIGARVDLIVECVNAMRFATTELTHKVVTAHREIGIAITRAIIQVVNPFVGVKDLQETTKGLDALMEKVKAYPDLQKGDIATVYAKANLRQTIWNTRFERDKKILGKTSFEVYDTLNRAITKAVSVQLRTSSTVADVDQAVVNLNQALKEALSNVRK